MDGTQTTGPVQKNKRGLLAAGVALFALSGIILALVYISPKKTAEPVVTRVTPNAYASVALVAKAAVVYDLTTGETLYAKNQNVQLPLASITKLLSTYAAVDALANDTPVVISKNALSMDGDSGLKEGETFRFSDLARFALIASSNDAAEAIAETSESRRAETGTDLLASAAATAGLNQTYAINGTGLDESSSVAGAYGSALDIAKLAGSLLKKAPTIAHATVEPSIEIRATNGATVSAENTNPNVEAMPGLLLSKTGYTDLAGGNLVIVFDAGINHPVAVAVLGSTRDDRFTDTNTLVRATLAHFAGVTPTI